MTKEPITLHPVGTVLRPEFSGLYEGNCVRVLGHVFNPDGTFRCYLAEQVNADGSPAQVSATARAPWNSSNEEFPEFGGRISATPTAIAQLTVVIAAADDDNIVIV